MKIVAIIYVISYILDLSICSDSTNVCPADIAPCYCEFRSELRYLCEEIQSISQVQNVIPTLPSPIEYLSISSYNSLELPDDIFKEVCIVRLYISLHQLNISDSLFKNQTECLQVLSLGREITGEYPVNAFLPLKHLRSLSFTRSNVTELKGPFWKLKLRYLRFERTNLARIYSNVFPRTLVAMTLSSNRLESLNSSLLFLSNLAYLDISYNRIKSLNGELTDLINLQELNVKHNQINTLDDSLHNLFKLEMLDLAENRIVSLSNSFHGLNNLKELDLGYNSLTKLNGTEFQSLINLKLLFLYENQLNSLGNSLIHLKNLNLLHLQGNQLSEVGTGFSCLNNLKMLVLSDNRFENLDFFNIENEQENCHFRESNQLERLSLIGNPLQCTSNLTLIISNLIQNNVTIRGNPCLK